MHAMNYARALLLRALPPKLVLAVLVIRELALAYRELVREFTETSVRLELLLATARGARRG